MREPSPGTQPACPHLPMSNNTGLLLWVLHQVVLWGCLGAFAVSQFQWMSVLDYYIKSLGEVVREDYIGPVSRIWLGHFPLALVAFGAGTSFLLEQSKRNRWRAALLTALFLTSHWVLLFTVISQIAGSASIEHYGLVPGMVVCVLLGAGLFLVEPVSRIIRIGVGMCMLIVAGGFQAFRHRGWRLGRRERRTRCEEGLCRILGEPASR